MKLKPFGYEQQFLENHSIRRLLVSLFGESHFGIRARQIWLSKIFEKRLTNAPQAILDAGCGKGHTSFWLAEHYPNAFIQGIDINSKEIERCFSIKKSLRIENVDFQKSNIEDFSSSQKYDFILCVDVLEHVENWQQAVQSLMNLLQPRGVLLIHMPHSGKYQNADYGFRKYQRTQHRMQANPSEGIGHTREGLTAEDFDFLKAIDGFDVASHYTFGKLTMWSHGLFELYRGSSHYLRFLFNPCLLALTYAEAHFCFGKLKDGGGLFIEIRKK